MIATTRYKSLLLLCLLVATATAWELPSFLTENLPSLGQDQANNNERVLQNNEQMVETNTEVDPMRETDTPTESPAPSPSPSETPTITPTITDKPTGKPTESPTESPAPSPSPSEQPTLLPSDSPSATPTNHPSELPSDAPSDAPSTSMQPSASPTHMQTMVADFTVQWSLNTGKLNDTQIVALENATAAFVDDDVAISSGRLADVVVDVTGQAVVEISNATTSMDGTRRVLQSSEFNLEQALTLNFSVTALYMGSDHYFDLHDVLNKLFQDPVSPWFENLKAAGVVFDSPALPPNDRGALPSAITGSEQSNGGGGMSTSAVVFVALLAVAAIGLSIAASVYSVRHYKRNVYGHSLRSPRLSNGSLGSRIANENLEYHTNQLELETSPAQFNKAPKYEEEDVAEDSTVASAMSQNVPMSPNFVAENSIASSWMGQKAPMSPNSLENGAAVAFDEIMKPNPKHNNNSFSHIQHSNSNNTRAKDPPTAATEINLANEPNNMTSLFDNNTEMSDMTRSLSAPPKSDNKYLEMNHEVMLTKSMGGTLGANAVAGSKVGSGFTASDFSSHASSFFSGLVGGQGQQTEQAPIGQPNGNGGERLGAVAVEPTLEMEQVSYDSMTNRAGLYDVFAPPGPIGIVVDTTKHGPAVHSLKRTSPMLGLINPGDLIVGLDDEDARSMTAATLTRLMARKSNQKERKITLLTANNF